MTANERYLPLAEFEQHLNELDKACHAFNHERIRELLLEAPTDFNPTDGIGDLVWCRLKDETAPSENVKIH